MQSIQQILNSGHFPIDEVAFRLSVAIGSGMLVGFEREWSNKDVGIRTFALVSMFGMLSVLISLNFALAGAFGVFLLIGLVNVRSLRVDNSPEITTSAALLVVYSLGVLAGQGHLFTPVASSIILTMLLAWKTELHRFAGGLRPEEIRSAILLGLIGFVIYPVLPNEYLDPWKLVNPRSDWVSVIAIAGIGFVNYILLRLYGDRGLRWSAVLGGLVNSTAAAAELAKTVGTALNSTISLMLLTIIAMFGRNLLLLAIFDRKAVGFAALPLVSMAVVGVLFAWFNVRRDVSTDRETVQLSSPMSLPTVLKFGGVLVAIEIIGTAATRLFGGSGMIAVGILGGLASSASTTAAAAAMSAQGKIPPHVAGLTTVLTSMTSAIVNLPVIWRQTKRREIVSKLAIATLLLVAVGGFTMAALAYLRF